MQSKTLRWDRNTGVLKDREGSTAARVAESDLITVCKQNPEYLSGTTLIVRCGAHAGVDPEPTIEGLANWSAESWEPFNQAVEQVTARARAGGGELVVLPGAGGRLSDAVCTVSWSNAHREIGLLIDPVGWLTPSMVSDLDDHLTRFTSLCFEIPNVWGVVVRSVRLDDAGALVHAPIGEGLISEDRLGGTLRTLETPRWIEVE